jgi:hypothetical protein
VEIGSFGSNELLLYGGIGQPALRAMRAMLLLDQRSSWCDKALADPLTISNGEAQRLMTMPLSGFRLANCKKLQAGL